MTRMNRSYLVSGGRNVTVRDAQTPHESGLRAYRVVWRRDSQRSEDIRGCIVVAPPNGTTQARTYWWAVDGDWRQRCTSLKKAADWLVRRHEERALVWGDAAKQEGA